MAERVKKYGDHGTTQANAEAILEQGFRIEAGRAGKGAYFWHRNHASRKLAEDWIRDRLEKNASPNAPSPKNAVIFCKLEAEANEVIDLNDAPLKDHLLRVMLPRVDNQRSFTTRQISGLYDLFVSEIEKRLKCSCKIVEVNLAPPRSSLKWYRIEVVGAVLCYVARTKDCITIEKVEII